MKKRGIITIDSNSISIFFYQLYFSNYIYTLTRKLIDQAMFHACRHVNDQMGARQKFKRKRKEKKRKKRKRKEKKGKEGKSGRGRTPSDTRHWVKEERDEWSVARVAPLMTVMHCVARFRVDDSVHLFLFPAIGSSFLSPVHRHASCARARANGNWDRRDSDSDFRIL